jgi:hypothetical protein
MLATLAFSFTNLANASTILAPDQKEQVATVLEDDAQIMSNSQLDDLIVTEPPEVEAEILRINDEARHIALQVALLVPLIAATLGFVVSLGMGRQPDPVASSAAEMVLGG